ncbi:hypothetical protein ACP70R_001025 [Stipagrostis hirtigluma subsp. patula]
MRFGGETGLGLRGGGGVGAMRRRGAAEEGEGSGCSGSSTTSRGSSGHGSSRGDSPPLTSFVRDSGRPGMDPEPDGLPTSSSSYEPRDEEDALEGMKDERWVHGRIKAQTKNAAPRSNGECQDQRHQQEGVLFHGRKDRTQRPASLDFGSPGVSRCLTHSPGSLVRGVGVMNNGLGVSSHNRSDVLSSPGTPNYHRRRTAVVGYQQGCNSEKALPPSRGHRRHPGSSMVMPYNSGRTLPSKWEDAERWIFSPNPSNALGRPLPQHWRPKSKSGPLGSPGKFGGPYSTVSSSAPFLDRGKVGNLPVNSPYYTGVLLPEHVCGGGMHTGMDSSRASGEDSSNGRGGRSGQTNGGHPVMQSTRVYQQFCSTVDSYQSLPTSQESTEDGETEITKDSTTSSTTEIVRKDVATQTSPDISRSSSPSMRPSFSRSLSVQQIKELESCFSKLEIRDVQMDDRVTLTRWSKKHVTRGSDKNSTNTIGWKKKTVESKSSPCEVTESAKCISKIEGEEAKMTAWENMQKAEAEAAIQKLVIKLEKKRPYSLERIFSTLRSGHRKTQVVRSTSAANHDQHLSRTIKRTSHLSKNGQMSSLSGCFTCHAF